MRRFVVLACACWFAVCAARENNIAPLAFGMTPAEAEAALGAPLAYAWGRRGSETFVAQYPIRVGTWRPADERVTLQFRRGRLTGWKHDWRTTPVPGLTAYAEPGR
jgi:hypothetical protein